MDSAETSLKYWRELHEEALEVENDSKESDAEPTYGSWFNDTIVRHWVDSDNPMFDISRVSEWFLKWNEIYSLHAAPFQKPVHIFRGTDYEPFLDLQEGTILDYSTRFTSWSYDRDMAFDFADPRRPLILEFVASSGLDLSRKFNRQEKEILLNPRGFMITKVIKTEKCKIYLVE